MESVACICEASPARPDLVLLDVGPPSATNGGLRQQIADIRKRYSELPVMAIADRDDVGLALDAIRDGLRGYLPTSLHFETAVAAIRLVLSGGTYVSREVVDFCVSMRPTHGQEGSGLVGHADGVFTDRVFTDREAEIVEQLQRGKPNKIIAYELRIAESTVKVHMRNIMRKLNATNRTQVAFLTRETS
ncbi:MAG: response regulator transcription factor [Methylobacteriaceae bacterium]|nr:response regulator transcription factor [Methylobacteriaceae bacterium]